MLSINLVVLLFLLTAVAADDDGVLKLFPLRKEGLSDDPKWFANGKCKPTPSRRPKHEVVQYFNYYSAAMYCTDQLHDLSCKYCQNFKNDVDTSKLIQNSTAETLALFTISEARSEIVVTVRGSSNGKNFEEDADTTMILFENDIRFHRGFYEAVMSIYDEVVKSIKEHLDQNPATIYRIVLTGHSLGGSMASIITFLLNYNKVFRGTEYYLITFGEPRTGNRLYVDYINSLNITTARVVNNADASPHYIRTNELKTTVEAEYYLHRQIEYWINGTENIWCNTSVYEDFKCSNSRGPNYLWKNHLHYFGVDYVDCILEQQLKMEAPSENEPL